MKKERILVTGGAGYIGSHMVKDLVDAGYEVIILDDLSKGHRDLITGGVLIEGDFGDRSLLEALFSSHRIDAVMHFAAYAYVGESVERPLEYFENNVSKTVQLLKTMVHHNVVRLIFSSSAAVYGHPIEIPIQEDHGCEPVNPYGSTKLAVEKILQYCDSAYGLRYVSLRYFNAAGADRSGRIGERHDPETHLIPLVLGVALGWNEDIKIFGTDYPTEDGTCIRDYIHVSDLGQAHLLALRSLLGGARSAVYNVGNSQGYSVREVITVSEKVTGRSIGAVESGRRAGDPAVLIAGAEKIRRELGWEPKYEDLETIIETAWAWHQKELRLKKE